MGPLQALSLFKQPVQPIEAAGVGHARQTEHNPFAAVPRTDAYAQHDRGLEHGFGGAQYRDGAVIGKKLNFEC